QYNESLKAEDKAIELDPTNSTFLVNKGFLIANMADVFGYKNASMYEDAVKEFDKAIRLDPKNMDAWNWKGMVLDSRLKRYDEALLAYDKVIEIGGTDADDRVLLSNAWRGKGYDLAMLGRYNESAMAFDRAIELNPQDAVYIWYANATALNASGLYDEAVKAYDKAIELSKGNITIAQAYEGKGSALLKLGKYDEAVSAYDKAIEQYPSEPMGAQAWYKKGIALQALGRTSQADAAFAKARELGYVGLASSEETTGKPSGVAEPSVEELATRLLQATYPGSTELNEVQLLAGNLPEDMPVDLPIPDGARIIGSEIQEDKGIYIVLDVPLMPDGALDFYRRALPSQNWTETTIPGMDRGFVRGDPSITFCKGMKNPSITVTAHPLENSTDLRISIISDPEYSPCSQASFDDWLRPIPKLSAPEGARQFNEMMTGGGNRAAVSATLETEMNSSALEDHYADQLGASNWTRKGGGRSGPQSWSVWSTEDEGGLVWNGFLIALD
ncbi:MAG: tetratricopeptide repeat protein, partial [Methanotrichaceae archaeon]|nr:tetratricopeptide repeat protein [Methanotrichaceae archaeon]